MNYIFLSILLCVDLQLHAVSNSMCVGNIVRGRISLSGFRYTFFCVDSKQIIPSVGKVRVLYYITVVSILSSYVLLYVLN
jgi:hypothetical protein